MNWKFNIGILSSILLLGLLGKMPTFFLSINKQIIAQASLPDTSSQNRACKIAKLITVKVMSEEDEGWGSGIIFYRKDKNYSVVTNAHVLRQGNHKIITHDGTVHAANLIKRFDNPDKTGDDLAILQFESNNEYKEAIPASGVPLESLEISLFAAGYPIDSSEFKCHKGGQNLTVMGQPMREGYQIGSNADIPNGMSGGPLLNIRGEVMGINGWYAYPTIPDPDRYQFQNSYSPVPYSEEVIAYMDSLSWAISFNKLRQLAPEFFTPPTAIVVNPNLTNPPELLQKVAVLVESLPRKNEAYNARNSLYHWGVIIAEKGNSYFVLTNAKLGEYNYRIHLNNQSYSVDSISTIKENSEFLVLEFNSQQKQAVANRVNTEDISPESKVYFIHSTSSNNQLTINALTYQEIKNSTLKSTIIFDEKGNLIALLTNEGKFMPVKQFLKLAKTNPRLELILKN